MSVLVGPRGGMYTMDSRGRKHYVRGPTAKSPSPRPPGTPNTPPAGNTLAPRDVLRVDGPHAYYRYALGTGATLHMFGEFHAASTRCQPCRLPTCMSMSHLLQRMFDASSLARQRMDLFVEQSFADDNGAAAVIYNHNQYKNSNSQLLHVRQAHGYRRDEFSRVHRMNMRDHRDTNDTNNRSTDMHPVITDLYEGRVTPENSLGPEAGMHLASIFLESDTFEKDIRDALYTYGATKRNSTRYDGKSVSRVRKQLLKLPAALRNSLVQSVYATLKQSKYGQRYLAMFLMDVAQMARMLHYAGYGSSSPSKVLVSYGGAWHTHNMAVLLDRAIAAGSLPGGVRQVDGRHQVAPNSPCLSVRMPLNFGFTK